MEIVLDSNVLFRTLISTGNILEILFNKDLMIIAPQKLKEEFLNNKKEILQKSRLTEAEFENLATALFKIITFIPIKEYAPYIEQATKLLKQHKKDEDFIALCIARKTKLWTYEKLLIDIGFGINTEELARLLGR